MIASCSILLRMFWTKVIEEIRTYILCSITFFPENRAVCEIMWKNNVEPGRPQMTIRRMRIACWITKATNTHSEYVILIDFPLQQCFHERASMLRHMYIACLVVWFVYMTDRYQAVDTSHMTLKTIPVLSRTKKNYWHKNFWGVCSEAGLFFRDITFSERCHCT
jgi:hypothetical protein